MRFGQVPDYPRMKRAPELVQPVQYKDVLSPSVPIVQQFAFQSFFDSTQLQNAILSAPPNQAIIPSTKAESQLRGYAVGLHPASQAPLAVQFRSGDKSTQSTVFILKPGHIVRPTGKPIAESCAFNGFTYGLPFGWLGGGIVQLYVFTTPDADVLWHGNPELLFHRMRVPIKQPTDLTAGGAFNNAPLNWPMRFPWTQALQGANQIIQKGQAAVAITEGTRTIIALRGASSLAMASAMRIIYQATNDFGLNSDGSVNLTNPIFEDVTWGSFSSIGTSGNLATQNPFQVLTGGITRLAADDGGIVMVDNSGAARLSGLFVDVARYGRL